MIAVLKRTLTCFLQNLQEVANASAAARMTANSPAYNKSAKNINVSEAEIYDLNLGI